jgi:peroxiredoxin
MLKAGTKAPGARVAVRPREWVDLKSYMGGQPLVLLFFPMAFSSTCTSEMCAVADDWSTWQNLGGTVLGISVDSPYVNVRFAEETKAPFPIVSDFNREASRAYDVLREDLGGLKDVSERAVFVIDRTGTICYTWQGEHPGVLPPLDEVKEAVRKAS